MTLLFYQQVIVPKEDLLPRISPPIISVPLFTCLVCGCGSMAGAEGAFLVLPARPWLLAPRGSRWWSEGLAQLWLSVLGWLG